MSSGQWEVVGKNKKNNKGKNDDKNPLKNGPKLEDILPNSQIKSMYGGMESGDDKKVPKENKKKESKPKAKQNDKKHDQHKQKPPKNIVEALQQISTEELSTIITTNKVRFTNAPLVWLKEVAAFLNSKTQIDVEDPTFSHYPPSYPLSEMPKETRLVLESIFKEAGAVNSQLFFDVTLTAMANDISRGQSVNGHRVLLQLLGQEYPDFCIASVQKSVSLRNSYQNRSPIGLSLLWALGQGGAKDFGIGLHAWQELFFPIIDLKNYSKYIVNYLTNLLDRHIKMDTAKITQENFLSFFDLINTKRNSLSKDLLSDLIDQLIKLKDIYFKSTSSSKQQVTFNQLMKKLPNQYLDGSILDPINQLILESLVQCLIIDDACNNTWRQLFVKCTKQSLSLLDYIDSHWEELSSKLKNKSLKLTVTQYKELAGDTLRGKKKDETVNKANNICQNILDKMTSTKRGFPWLWASFFLLISIAGLISYDVSQAGGHFPKSATGKLLNDIGVLEQTQYAWQKSLSTSARGYLWLEVNAPIYYNTAIDKSKPYAELGRDIAIVGAKKAGLLYGNIRDYVVEKTPVVASTIEQYAPGLIENVQSYSAAGWTAVKTYSVKYYQVSADYFKTKVFVGEWAPEIIQNKTETAFNSTKFHITSYLHWLRQQVHVYSEIP